MSKIKHISWSDRSQSGRLGFIYDPDNNRIKMRTIAGNCLPAKWLEQVLDAALGENWKREAEQMHLGRRNPWKTEIKERTSGAREYLLRVLEGEEFFSTPIKGGVHVSMRGKLNGGVQIWLGDLAPILPYIVRDYPAEDPEKFFFRVEEIFPEKMEGFNLPGTESGILPPRVLEEGDDIPPATPDWVAYVTMKTPNGEVEFKGTISEVAQEMATALTLSPEEIEKALLDDANDPKTEWKVYFPESYPRHSFLMWDLIN